MSGAFRGDWRPVLLVASVFAVAGCGGGGGSSPSPSATATPATGGIGIAVSVPTAAPIVADPASLAFAHAGSTQTAALSEAGYGAGFTPSTSNPNVATGSVAIDSLGTYLLTVTAVGQGSATIALASDNGGRGSVAVTVLAP